MDGGWLSPRQNRSVSATPRRAVSFRKPLSAAFRPSPLCTQGLTPNQNNLLPFFLTAIFILSLDNEKSLKCREMSLGFTLQKSPVIEDALTPARPPQGTEPGQERISESVRLRSPLASPLGGSELGGPLNKAEAGPKSPSAFRREAWPACEGRDTRTERGVSLGVARRAGK